MKPFAPALRPLLMLGTLCFGVAVLPGCDALVSGKSDQPAEKSKASKSKAQREAEASALAKERAEKAAEEEAGPEYVYNPIGKRDPFRSFLNLGERDDGDIPLTRLQRFEIDQYQLVGIIWGIDRPRALVEDPEAVGHVMEVGTYIGKNWGKVTQITSTEVVVTEEYQTIGGELVVNTITMGLPDQELQ